MPSKPIEKIDPKKYLKQAVHERLTARVLVDHPTFDRDLAERIVNQTTAFLVAAARTDEPLSPSPMVDIGWHTFILHTREYADFCHDVAGRFLHHVPEFLDAEVHGGAKPVRDRTVAAMTAAGFDVDAELWPTVADCNQCHAGCHDSPR